jgi:outer membrane immunogenic protein
MKKLLLASSALLFCGPVVAADLPARMSVKAPVVAAVPYSWTGCYVGGHVGAGWDRTSFADPSNPSPTNPGLIFQTIAPLGSSVGVNGGAGVLGGAQAGCDYQFANHWVVGIAGDFSWTDIHGLANDPFFGNKNGTPYRLSTRTDQLATVTGRVGYAWDHFLLYGKGGAAWAHDRYGIQNLNSVDGIGCGIGASATCNPTGSANRAGWTVGAGLEWAFAGNWSALVEYDHYGFDSKGVGFSDPNSFVAATANLNVRQNIDVVKVGVNYRFWTPGPVVARY